MRPAGPHHLKVSMAAGNANQAPALPVGELHIARFIDFFLVITQFPIMGKNKVFLNLKVFLILSLLKVYAG